MEKYVNGIVYHEDYNKYDLGVDHPLVGDKPRKTMAFLKEKSIMKKLKYLHQRKQQKKIF